MLYYKHINQNDEEVGVEIRTIDIYGKKETVLEITKDEAEQLMIELSQKSE